MHRGLHTFAAAGALLLAACTVEIGGDKSKSADSAAATRTDTVRGTVTAQNGADSLAAATPRADSAAGALALDSSARGATTGAAMPDTTSPGAASPGAASPAAASPGSTPAVGRPGTNLAASAADTVRPLSDLRIDVDVAARRLTLFKGDKRVSTYRIGVGSKEWPTQPGQWNVKQVIWHPAWIPPRDESWAEEAKPKEPGAPDNPLGTAQLVYDPPRTIHGTDHPESIGKPVSHGSIRMPNADVERLARQVMEGTGAGKDDAWYREVKRNRTQKQIVDLPQLVPITVH